MRDNLMFYGLPEESNENCGSVIKTLIAEKLQLQQAGNLTFDRVHRVGLPTRGKSRPIVQSSTITTNGNLSEINHSTSLTP